MDEKTLIALWPAMLAAPDLAAAREELEALILHRDQTVQRFEEQIASLHAQIERRQRLAAPLAEYRLDALALRFWPKVRIVDDQDSCWVWTGGGHKGRNENYGIVRLSPTETTTAHRIAYRLTHDGELPPVVRHTCDNPPCCRPGHLVPGTQADNIQDRVDRGRGRGKTHQRGEDNDSAVLTDQIVLAARRRYRGGESVGQLAEAFCVALGTLQGALSGKTWSHLDDIEPPIEGRRSGSKLTEDDVRAIRAAYATKVGDNPPRGLHGQVCAELGERYDLSAANINAIVRRKSWKHID